MYSFEKTKSDIQKTIEYSKKKVGSLIGRYAVLNYKEGEKMKHTYCGKITNVTFSLTDNSIRLHFEDGSESYVSTPDAINYDAFTFFSSENAAIKFSRKRK